MLEALNAINQLNALHSKNAAHHFNATLPILLKVLENKIKIFSFCKWVIGLSPPKANRN